MNIERILDARGHSWNWLVKAANALMPEGEQRLSNTRCSRWKDGRGWPRPGHLAAIARALDVSCDHLLSETGEPPPPERTPEEKILLDVVFRGPTAIGLNEAIRRISQAAPGWQGPGMPPPAESKYLGGAVIKGRSRAGRPRKPKATGMTGKFKLVKIPAGGEGPEEKGEGQPEPEVKPKDQGQPKGSGKNKNKPADAGEEKGKGPGKGKGDG